MANKLTFVAQSAEEAEDLRARGVAYEYEGQTYEPDVPVAKNEDEFKALWNDGVKFEYDGVLYPSDVKERNRLIENSKGLAKIFMQVMGAEGESLDDLLAQSAEVAKGRQMDKLKELSRQAAKAALTFFDFMASEVIEALREADPADSSRTVAEALTERQRDFWAFPYTDNPLIEGFGAQTLITGMPAIEAVEERRAEVIELIGAGTYEMAFEASKRIGQDFDLLLEGMKDGRVRTPEGHAWPTYSADTLAWVDNERGGATLDHIKAGDPDLTLLTAMLGMGDEERLYEGYAPADEQTRRAIAEGEETPVGRPLTLLLDYRRNHDLQFDALNVLCNRGYEAQLRDILRPEPLEEVKAVAVYPLEEMAANHAFINKALDGLVWIAHGHKSYDLEPKNAKSKSKEKYKLTASEDACGRFFHENKGANTEHAKAVMSAVYTMRTDRRAEGFVHKGRIWFPESTILREMLRTQQGSIEKPRGNTAGKKLVHDAIAMLSSAQVSGRDFNGEPIALEYFMQAAYREKLSVGGSVMTGGFWGFPENATPIEDYSKEIGASYNYPLLDMEPMSIKNVWLRPYLLNVLNQARGELYTRSGRANPRKKNKKIKRAWSEIFGIADPLKDGNIPPKTKQRIVDDAEKVLRALAKMDSKGKLREGRPMTIRAYSERDGSKGRGKGEWKNLVIECTTSYRAYKDSDISLS